MFLRCSTECSAAGVAEAAPPSATGALRLGRRTLPSLAPIVLFISESHSASLNASNFASGFLQDFSHIKVIMANINLINKIKTILMTDQTMDQKHQEYLADQKKKEINKAQQQQPPI